MFWERRKPFVGIIIGAYRQCLLCSSAGAESLGHHHVEDKRGSTITGIMNMKVILLVIIAGKWQRKSHHSCSASCNHELGEYALSFVSFSSVRPLSFPRCCCCCLLYPSEYIACYSCPAQIRNNVSFIVALSQNLLRLVLMAVVITSDIRAYGNDPDNPRLDHHSSICELSTNQSVNLIAIFHPGLSKLIVGSVVAPCILTE